MHVVTSTAVVSLMLVSIACMQGTVTDPDIEATVQARVQATVEAQHVPPDASTSPFTPTANIHATVAAGVQATVAALPLPTPITLVETVVVTATPMPPPTPAPIARPDVVLEYEIRVQTHGPDIPEDVADRYGRDGYQWVVVIFDVLEGELDMMETWFESRVETSDRFYDLDHATSQLRFGVQPRGAIKSGHSGIALYQIPIQETTYSWNLDNSHQRVLARRR